MVRKIIKRIQLFSEKDPVKKRLLQLNANREKIVISSDYSTAEFVDIGITVKGNYDHLVEGYWYLENIAKNYKSVAFRVVDGILFLEYNGLKIRILTKEELYIFHEVFLNRIYDIHIPYTSYRVIDIGMNVGMASLFFASKEGTIVVDSYEPVSITYNDALYNLSLNPDLQTKIHPNQVGIGGQNDKIRIIVDPKNKGRTSTTGLYAGDGHEEELTILSFVESVVPVIEKDKQPVILKIDCEGSEYAIFESIKYIPDNLKAIVMEFHHGPDPLLSFLREHGFSYNYLAENTNTGMIYAYR